MVSPNERSKPPKPIPDLLTGMSVWQTDQGPVTDVYEFDGRRLPPLDDASINAFVSYAAGAVARLERIESNLMNSGVSPAVDSATFNHFLHHYPEVAGREKALEAIIAIKASVQIAQAHCAK